MINAGVLTKRHLVSVNFAEAAFPGMALDQVIGQRISAGGRQLDIIGIVGNTTTEKEFRVGLFSPSVEFA